MYIISTVKLVYDGMLPHIVDAGKFLRITRILFRHAATAASTTIQRAATSFREYTSHPRRMRMK